jgi:glycosyltransferase involved in cell wall biosynthesis
MSATVIIPTTGASTLGDAIESVLKQSYKDTICYVVVDGEQALEKAIEIKCKFDDDRLVMATLPINVGAKGFYGHRVYAAFTHLVNSEYVLYLDQDNWFYDKHVEYCVETIERRGLDWAYSLRQIHDRDGTLITLDNCESLGKWPVFSGDYNHIDTNCYCLKTKTAIQLAQVWHGGWGQDRVFLQAISKYFPKFDCSNEYSVHYRLDGNKGSVQKEFFEHGNEVMFNRYNGVYPWHKKT